VAANRQALEFANDRYDKGLADFLNVLDAERSLYQTEDQLADSQGTVSVNLVVLYKALGGGWNAIEQRADASSGSNSSR
jgi:outer membrane protein TolC